MILLAFVFYNSCRGDKLMPGIYADTVLRLGPLVPLIDHSAQLPYDYPMSVNFFGAPLPLVQKIYIGAPSPTYFTVFKLFGISPESLMWTHVLLVFVVIAMLYAAYVRFFDFPTALLFLFLTLIDSSVVFSMLSGLWLTRSVAFVMYISLIRRQSRLRWFAIPFLLQGYAAYCYMPLMVTIFGYFAHFLFYLWHRKDISVQRRVFAYGAICTAFLAPITPLVYYNLTQGDLFNKVYDSIFNEEKYNEAPVDGQELKGYWNSVADHLNTIQMTVNSRNKFITRDVERIPSSNYFWFLIGICLLGALIYAVHRRRRPLTPEERNARGTELSRDPRLVPILLILSMFGMVTVVPDLDSPGHVVTTIFYLKMVYAFVFVDAARRVLGSGRRWMRLTFLPLLGLILLGTAGFAARNMSAVRTEILENAHGYWTPAIYKLIPKVDSFGDRPIVAIHWGISPQIYMFGKRHPVCTNLYHCNTDEQYRDAMRANPDAVYISFSLSNKPRDRAFNYHKFFEAAACNHRKPVLIDTVKDQRGVVTYELFELKLNLDTATSDSLKPIKAYGPKSLDRAATTSLAMWFQVEPTTSSLTVIFDGKPVETIQQSGVVTATVPQQMIGAPGKFSVCLFDDVAGNRTPSVPFTVRAAETAKNGTAPDPNASPLPPIKDYGPRQIEAAKIDSGQPFAMWFRTGPESETLTVMFDGKPLETFRNGDIVSAVVPREQLTSRAHDVYLLEQGSGSRTASVTFSVHEAAAPTPAPTPAPPLAAIKDFGPKFAEIGKVDSRQPFAMWFKIEPTTGSLGVMMDDKPLESARNGNMMSAVVPQDALKKPCEHRFCVVELGTGARTPAVTFVVKKAGEIAPLPAIVDFGPKSTVIGKGFALQPDGSSAMWFKIEPTPGVLSVVFDGRAIETARNGDLVTALVPASFLKKSGKYPVYIKDKVSKAKTPPVTFAVTGPAKPLPAIKAFGPKSVQAGDQKGTASLVVWFKIAPTSGSLQAVFDETPLESVHQRDVVTATIPPQLLKRLGRHSMYLVKKESGSRTPAIGFEVRK